MTDFARLERDVQRLIANGELSEASALCPVARDLEVLRSQWSIARAYYNIGDFDAAIDHFKKVTAFKNDPDTFFWIGRAYFSKKEYFDAKYFFEQAAEFGFFRAYHWIAACYYFGLGVKVDFDKAAELYALSSRHGFFIGQRGIYMTQSKGAGLAKVLSVLLKRYLFAIKVMFVAMRDVNDRRLIDLSDAIERMKIRLDEK